MPAKPVAPATQPATSSQPLVLKVDSVVVAPTILFGWSAAESTGSAPASFRLHDGANAEAPQLTALIALNGGETTRDWFGDEAVEVASGAVYLEVVEGSVELVALLG